MFIKSLFYASTCFDYDDDEHIVLEIFRGIIIDEVASTTPVTYSE